MGHIAYGEITYMDAKIKPVKTEKALIWIREHPQGPLDSALILLYNTMTHGFENENAYSVSINEGEAHYKFSHFIVRFENSSQEPLFLRRNCEFFRDKIVSNNFAVWKPNIKPDILSIDDINSMKEFENRFLYKTDTIISLSYKAPPIIRILNDNKEYEKGIEEKLRNMIYEVITNDFDSENRKELIQWIRLMEETSKYGELTKSSLSKAALKISEFGVPLGEACVCLSVK